jgi:hypothetical protein
MDYEKVNVEYSECVPVALVIRQAVRMRHIISSSVACLSQTYLFTLSHKRCDFREKSFIEVRCVF